MSNYNAMTFHPTTGKLESASWMDDHFGHYHYGVLFKDGKIFKAEECEQVGPKGIARIEARELELDVLKIKWNHRL